MMGNPMAANLAQVIKTWRGRKKRISDGSKRESPKVTKAVNSSQSESHKRKSIGSTTPFNKKSAATTIIIEFVFL